MVFNSPTDNLFVQLAFAKQKPLKKNAQLPI